ncbi:MAG: D-sedoheptulose 7-phosphate isomerase [Nitrospinaceae bacterium]|nr:D-sedoheptulose 7-phosphate isomerase [Nitrospina sp.]MBT5377359.1 D-sedoheptulose 7-phosphate isomerase [Nitrospinaceae bacterium]MBT5867318.1 D-sedoheptulose 7-phosphate isomerase [Nitrospinaceae bacterium]MBT6346512.1 D-sedoheptulose 7-phosphate isomerase [Nitrospina sp.]
MQRVKNFLYSSAELKKTVADTLSGDILTVANDVQSCLQKGGKLILMGNGGSAADSQHIAAELIGRFKKERRAMPAIALTVDTSSLTALGNDYGFDTIFERQIEALAQKNDAVIGISTSGNSENVVRALKKANAIGAKTIGLVGNNGGKIKEVADLSIVVPSNDTARIQEVHITIGHIICELIEEDL